MLRSDDQYLRRFREFAQEMERTILMNIYESFYGKGEYHFKTISVLFKAIEHVKNLKIYFSMINYLLI